MNKLSNPVVIFVQREYQHTLFLLVSALVFVYVLEDSHRFPSKVGYVLPWVLLLAVASVNRLVKTISLLVVVALLGWSVLTYYYQVPNHGFMILYIVVALLVAQMIFPHEPEFFKSCCLGLLAVLMGVALIQKLASSYYLKGNLMAEYVLSGFIYKNVIGLFDPDWRLITSNNFSARSALASDASGASVRLEGINQFTLLLIFLFTYVSLFIQFLLELALLFHKRVGGWLHVGVLGFVAIIYASLNENIFLSANCILGYALTNDAQKVFRLLYVIAIFYLLTASLFDVRLPLFV